MSGILLALRTAKRSKPSFPAEQQLGRLHVTVGDLLKSSFASIPENNPTFWLALDESPHDANSTILVRERARGSILESAFRKQTGRIINVTTHTLSLLLSGKAATCLLSKRDVAYVPATRYATLSRQNEVTNRSKRTERRASIGISAEQ